MATNNISANNVDLLGLKLITLANQYATNVSYICDNRRLLIKKLIDLMKLWQELKKLSRKKKSVWIKPWRNSRKSTGLAFSIVNEFRINDENAYRNYLRMSEENFEFILGLVERDLLKKDTAMRKAITPKQQLSLTLRYLATGESLRSLGYQSKISASYLVECIPKVCEAIYTKLKNRFLKFPDSHEEWEAIAREFERKWQFPLCLGALDGKHINFYASEVDGAYFHNYKGMDSIILLALADANCKFIFIDVGANGRTNDSGVLRRSPLQTVLDNGEQYFPAPRVIGNNRLLPYTIVADSAFALQTNLMKPFSYQTTDPSKKMFNRRLSRARQVVERAFGILSTRFLIFRKPINLRSVSKIEIITQASCVLHNFLMGNSEDYENLEINDQRSQNINPIAFGRNQNDAIRSTFMEYFMNEGKLNWMQEN